MLVVAGAVTEARGTIDQGRARSVGDAQKDPKADRRRSLGNFKTREAAEKHERQVQYFKRHA